MIERDPINVSESRIARYFILLRKSSGELSEVKYLKNQCQVPISSALYAKCGMLVLLPAFHGLTSRNGHEKVKRNGNTKCGELTFRRENLIFSDPTPLHGVTEVSRRAFAYHI